MHRPGLLIRIFVPVLLLAVVGLRPGTVKASDDQAAPAPAAKADQSKAEQPSDEASDPLKRPVDAKRKKENAKALKKEVMSKEENDWLTKDVPYIITDEERKAFKQLSNEEEREKFIESFWDRRNPNPDSEDNEFKDEHYRRIEYANERYAAGVPGWRTDRGRIYIVHGPPDEIDSHPAGGQYERPIEEGGGQTSTYPFETWRYRHLDGIGEQVEIEFVDDCQCGAYEMTIDRSKKDALLMVPGAGLTAQEQMQGLSKNDRFLQGGLERLGVGSMDRTMNESKQFERLEQFAKLNSAPPVKFKDLEEVVRSKITYNAMPFDVRTDFVKITNDTVLVPVTIQLRNRDITFVDKEGVEHGVVNIFGRLTSISGKVAQTFEDTVEADVPSELLAREAENYRVYWKAVPLKSGRYKLDVVVKDINGDRVGTISRAVTVPDFSDEKLASSTLIVADDVEPVPTNTVGTGMFVIGTTKVRPRVSAGDGKPSVFKRGQKVNFWMQVYNLGVDDKTHKPSATFEYDIVNASTNKAIVHAVDSSDKMGNLGNQVTLHKVVASANLDPGVYRIQINVNDNVSKQKFAVPSALFSVE